MRNLSDAEILDLLGPEYASAKRRSAAGFARDEPGGPKEEGGPAHWVRQLAELLGRMFADPAMQVFVSGGRAAPAETPGSGEVPPELPSPSNPSGASSAPKLPGAAADSAPTLGAIIDGIAPKRAPRRTLDQVVNAISRKG